MKNVGKPFFRLRIINTKYLQRPGQKFELIEPSVKYQPADRLSPGLERKCSDHESIISNWIDHRKLNPKSITHECVIEKVKIFME